MSYLFGLIRRNSLYGTIALIVAFCIRKADISVISSFMNGRHVGIFVTSLIICGIILPVVEILFVIYRKLSEKFGDGCEYGVEDFFVTVFRDITYPFISFGTLIKGIVDKDFISTELGWFETIFSFIWTIGWVIYLVVGMLLI